MIREDAPTKKDEEKEEPKKDAEAKKDEPKKEEPKKEEPKKDAEAKKDEPKKEEPKKEEPKKDAEAKKEEPNKDAEAKKASWPFLMINTRLYLLEREPLAVQSARGLQPCLRHLPLSWPHPDSYMMPVSNAICLYPQHVLQLPLC